MNILGQKLKSRDGASVIIGMIFFLFCGVIGATILASAFSNTGRLWHIREEQQAYLSVSSAARLVRDELENLTFKIEVEETTITTTTTVNGIETPPIGPPDVSEKELSKITPEESALSDIIKGMAKDLYDIEDERSLTEDEFVKSDFSMELAPENIESNIIPVIVTLTMKGVYDIPNNKRDYKIDVEFLLDGEDDKYAMTMTIDADVKKEEAGSEFEEIEEVKEGAITKEIITKTEIKTTTTTVTWGTGTIVKGVK